MKYLTIWGEEDNENAHIDEISKGLKKAFCTPKAWYGTEENGPNTNPGETLILKNPSGKDCILIEISKVLELSFGEVNEKMAHDVLNCELQDFRDAHRFYWEEELLKDHIEFNDNLKIVFECFSILEVF